MIITANRASAVLCSYLQGKNIDKPFLLPANVCPVVPLSLMKAGVDFEFVDIDDTHAMSKTLAMEYIKSGKYAGMIFVHAYGRQFDNQVFYNEIKQFDSSFYIIDDRCLCVPDISGCQPPFTDLALYSTGYAKYVELSFGGYGISEHEVLSFVDYEYKELEETRQQIYIKECLRDRNTYSLPADYPWLDTSPLQMSTNQYFDVVRKKLPVVQKQKETINNIYREELPNSIQWGKEFENWRFIVSVKNRDEVLEAIFDKDLFAGTNFPSVSRMFKEQHNLRAEEEASHIINLFNDHRVNEDYAHKICQVINRTIQK